MGAGFGQYSLGRIEGDNYVPIVPWTDSPAISRFSAANILRVERSGAQITLHLNGTKLTTVTDAVHTSGKIGIDAINFSDASGIEASNDDLTVWNGEAATGTPTATTSAQTATPSPTGTSTKQVTFTATPTATQSTPGATATTTATPRPTETAVASVYLPLILRQEPWIWLGTRD